MTGLESLAAYEIRTKILALLRSVYLTWLPAEEAVDRCPPSLKIKNTKGDHHYVYMGKESKTRRATDAEIKAWKKCRELREIHTAQLRELKEIGRFYRVARLPTIEPQNAYILRELDKLRLLGRHVYVIGDLAAQAHDIGERRPARDTQPTYRGLHLFIVSNEQDYLLSLDRPESHATSIKALMAGSRDGATLEAVTATVEQVVKDAAGTGVVLYIKNQIALSSPEDQETLREWNARQWSTDEEAARTVVVLGSDGKPAPLITPEPEVIEILRRSSNVQEVNLIEKMKSQLTIDFFSS